MTFRVDSRPALLLRLSWALALLLVFLQAGEQTRARAATIRGEVADEQGSPVSTATVIVVQTTGIFQSAADGSFAIQGLEGGYYDIVVDKWGYTPWSIHGLQVKDHEDATVHVLLKSDTSDRRFYFESATEEDLREYDKALAALHERPFCADPPPPPEVESYRFLWLRTFHRPVFVSLILESDEEITAVYKETDGLGGYELGQMVKKKKTDVYKKLLKESGDKDLVSGAVEYLREYAPEEFWSQPFREEMEGHVGLDGATWTVEGRKNGRCHVVTRWSPAPEDNLRRFAETLIKLTGQRFYYDEVY